MDLNKTWKKVSEQLKNKITEGAFRTWFKDVGIDSIQEDKVVVNTPNAFLYANIKPRYATLLESVFEEVLGKKVLIDFVMNPQNGPKKEQAPLDEELFQTAEIITPRILNPKFTLENFVVGLTNNVAYAAAQAVAQNPGKSYNPLFIYGGTGVGKTHLMLGIGNEVLNKNPHARVIYCSSEKFTNDYVEAIQTRKMGDLRAKYRSADLLLVDDVQFFSGREGTQEEFFHTFNELTSKNSQLVLTSDRPPGEMPKLEDRLKSRFQGGLMVDIQMPDFDTRVAILKAKCLERGEEIPDESLHLIASNLETNARELEGKLIQALQSLKAKNLNPDPDNIRAFLGRPQINTPVKATYKQVISAICNYFNIKQGDLIGPKRKKELVLSRHLTMYILSEELNMTVEKVGEVLGGRDHTTVMHGRDRVKELLQSDSETQRLFSEVKQSLRG